MSKKYRIPKLEERKFPLYFNGEKVPGVSVVIAEPTALQARTLTDSIRMTIADRFKGFDDEIPQRNYEADAENRYSLKNLNSLMYETIENRFCRIEGDFSEIEFDDESDKMAGDNMDVILKYSRTFIDTLEEIVAWYNQIIQEPFRVEQKKMEEMVAEMQALTKDLPQSSSAPSGTTSTLSVQTSSSKDSETCPSSSSTENEMESQKKTPESSTKEPLEKSEMPEKTSGQNSQSDTSESGSAEPSSLKTGATD